MILYKALFYLGLLYLLSAYPAMAGDCTYPSDTPAFFKKHGLVLKGPTGISIVKNNENAWSSLKNSIEAGDTLFLISDRYSNQTEGFATLRNGCVSDLVRLPKTEQRTIAGNSSAEICIELRAGHSLNFEFGSSGPLDFNVHYHIDKDIHYVIRETGITRKSSGHQSAIRQDYCLMWTNPGTSTVNLSTTYAVY